MNKPILIGSVLLLTLLSCQPGGELFENALCIQNITIIDPIDGLKENQTLVIKDGKIHRVAPSAELKLSDQNTIIDGTGKYLIPGLWDTHVHFSYMEELAPRMLDLFLAYGITSVRDTGGDINFVNQWKQKALSNPTGAPRVMIAGPLLDGLPNVYDGSDPGHPPLSVGLGTVADVQDQIELLDSMDVDLLKAYEMLTPEQFATVTKMAREKGLKVTGHVPLSMDVISASNAGLNSMEHMRNLEISCASNWEALLQQRRDMLFSGRTDKGGILRSRIHAAQRPIAIENYDEGRANEVLGVLATNETWQIPTLTLATNVTERPFAEVQYQESFKYLPENVENQWKQNIEDFVNTRQPTEFQLEYTTWFRNMVGKVHVAGIDIMAGTDCPIFFLTPGRSLHQELVVLVNAGLSPLDALKTATYNPARYFNMENELGTIKENHWADLLILDANPLENIDHTRQINAVIKQGNYMDRARLDEMLAELDKL
ncbi:MAG: amidohydrolase family protein [Cytophagales bacterium]|nr:amidohydrolase family protein [Cytophagales bacterium]